MTTKKRAAKKRTRKPATDGFAYSFHGSYRNKEDAAKKAKKRGGFVISRVPYGSNKRRYIVLAESVPF